MFYQDLVLEIRGYGYTEMLLILDVMFHLIYTSHAVKPFSNDELIDLLNQSRVYNKEHGITGMLIYRNAKFMQVLEGEMTPVERIYSKIYKDQRHKRVVRVLEGNSEDRIFKNWSMGFKNLTDDNLQSMEGFQDVDMFFDEHKMTESNTMALVFLRLFYEKNVMDYPELV